MVKFSMGIHRNISMADLNDTCSFFKLNGAISLFIGIVSKFWKDLEIFMTEELIHFLLSIVNHRRVWLLKLCIYSMCSKTFGSYNVALERKQ